MKSNKFRTVYDGSADRSIDFTDVVSATDQQFKKDCDINEMLKQYRILGTLPNRPAPQFGDFASCSDYMSNLERVRSARDMFDSLPAKDRARFDGSFEAFLAAASNPANAALFVELGLVEGTIKEITPPNVVTADEAAKTAPKSEVGSHTT